MSLDQTSIAGSKKAIVIVDDDPVLSQIYQEVLEFEGYHVSLGGDGPQALELLSRIPPPELILVDFVMPGMSGVSFLKELKKENPTVFEKSLVIGLTGLFCESSLLEEMQAMVCRLAEKPSNIFDVVKLIKETIG